LLISNPHKSQKIINSAAYDDQAEKQGKPNPARRHIVVPTLTLTLGFLAAVAYGPCAFKVGFHAAPLLNVFALLHQ